jgi:hypothetical protein
MKTTNSRKGSSSARQRAGRYWKYYRIWFVTTIVALLIFVTLYQRQDSATDFLLKSSVARTLTGDDFIINGPTKTNSESVDPREPDPTTSHRQVEIKTHEVFFLNETHLSHHDGFSASWLQSRSDFVNMPFDEIYTCESAAFRAYDGRRTSKMRMTNDWMQFSVEHLSKWFKILEWDVHNDTLAYDSFTTKLQTYIAGAPQDIFQGDNNLVLKNTLAVIAFQSYKHLIQPDLGHKLTALSLASTLESLRRAGMGRVVVGVLVDSDVPIVQDAFRYLGNVVDQNPLKRDIHRIGHMEVGYAFASAAYIKTRVMMKNMPRATVMTLRDALNYSLVPEQDRTEEMAQNMTAWLGDTQDASYWEYFYLTEPDTILQTRPEALSAIKAEIDNGGVVLPHRWQPIPHESDVRGMDPKRGIFLLEDEFPEVLELDPKFDACCDENAGQNFKPGKPPFYKLCNDKRALFWYSCGFHPKNRDDPNRHERLSPYKLMRITGGTEVVTLVGSEHGRRCIPKKEGSCGAPSKPPIEK